MKIKETGFTYNLTTGGRGTPDWGAELGQGEKKIMNVDGVSDILNGMLYYKVDEISNIKAVLGRGNNKLRPINDYLPDTSIVLGSIIEKVSVNNVLLRNIKFIMFITKDMREFNGGGDENTQYQRRYLKFPITSTYNDNPYNEQCIHAITQALNCGDNGSWLVYKMEFNEDVLNLSALVVDAEKPHDFLDKGERSRRIEWLIQQQTFGAPSTFEGELSPVILFGPPGTGKTYKMQNDYISHFDKTNRFSTTFHQSYSYEEFVEGLKPVSDTDDEDVKYQIVQGVLRIACERAAQLAGYPTLQDCLDDLCENRKKAFTAAVNQKRLVLLCIDEINRGNVAAIFGDLISLMEDSKRLGEGAQSEMIVSLPYSKDNFGVPKNLVIVGTMNTADRSIQLLDSALRRRFKFVELLPDYAVFKDVDTSKKAKTILENINAKIRCLLNKDNQIGHSYLMFVKSDEDILDAIINKIIPLLEEYFHNDIEKVRFVLNEDDETNHPFYVKDEKAETAFNKYITKNDIDSEEKSFFELKIDTTISAANYIEHLLR
jgi:hypothetical protein